MAFCRLAFPPRWQTESTASQHATSDTNHSSHDDLLSHNLACTTLSAKLANNGGLHIKTAGRVITFPHVDVLPVSLLFLSPPNEKAVWGHRSNLSTTGTVISILWFVLLYASLPPWPQNCIWHSQCSLTSPSPLWVCWLLQIHDLYISNVWTMYRLSTAKDTAVTLDINSWHEKCCTPWMTVIIYRCLIL